MFFLILKVCEFTISLVALAENVLLCKKNGGYLTEEISSNSYVIWLEKFKEFEQKKPAGMYFYKQSSPGYWLLCLHYVVKMIRLLFNIWEYSGPISREVTARPVGGALSF